MGDAKVKRGFSIPPNGKLGGKITIEYVPHIYGVTNDSTVPKIFSRSYNSR